ncbi:ABC transporter ATP-binding protein [Staphylococcus capitis]|uniref:ABC transporter ATP-binding protein n=1 Tax=Staphylococcus capitis TaxID=29388 RepID=UPI001655A714|nr:ABC transporter ATP-binding protein [Staphylococcus capitis]MBC8781535.1 ABC transporter ATP-binding protein [Staphylococcus capitis]MCM3509080.1 ABC transporter ATP-binding protein/permease [Staphylococcus capitis]MDH9600885.1 ABC transporter ATP-binding protein [Staphylococcus capitis]MDH9624638.1 ABC transporter ATP-binding protein [Staphylococcus capitis]MDS4062986.1 ABC transporter ATP-binding protein [Staphylococcus capitis]
MKKNVLLNIIKRIPIPKISVTIAITISTIASILGLLVPLYTGSLIDKLNKNLFDFGFLSIFVLIFIANTILNGIGMYILSKIGENIIFSIRNLLWNHIIRLKFNFYDQNESGQLLSRIIDDTKIINNFISLRLPDILPSILMVIGSLCMLFVLDWKLTMVIFTILFIFLICMYPLGQIMEKLSTNTQNETAKFSGLISKILTNIYLVKSNGTEEKESENGRIKLTKIYQLGLKQAKINSILEPLSGFLIMLLIALILSIGTWRVSHGDITSGNLVAMIFYVFQLVSPISNLISLITDYKKATGASQRISEILDEEQEYLNLLSDQKNISGSIKFENVSFSYGNELILDNVSFTIPENKVTAFVGPSGSGKSTILKLIENMYKIDSGNINIGNLKINEVNLKEWRKKVGYVIQGNSMINGTIKENLVYGNEKEIDDKTLDYYTYMANCRDFIDSLDKGYDTKIGENGMKISGGQQQRLSIARGFIKNPDYLLLDEVTSNLDSESEQKIQDSLTKLMNNKTTIIIAHRLSTIKKANQIIFIDNGKITGKGTHLDLMKHHTKYKNFVLTQDL